MKIYIDVFVLGLTLSWGVCFSFCAPIIFSYIAGTRKGWLAGLKASLTFSLARIIPYVILSLISATLGSYLIKRFYESQAALIIYIAAGIFVAFLGIIVVSGKSQNLHFCLPFRKFALQDIREMVLLGLMVGFAPCLPLLGLLTYVAFNARNFLQGAFLGLAFGGGTLISPLILCGPLAGGTAGILLKKPFVYKIFSRICGLILMYLGIGMIIRFLR